MELTIEQALQQAVTAHKEGELEEAERLYRAILQSQPAHPDANHNLGVIAVSVNKANAALPFFKSALEANPKIEQFWLSYIGALLTENKTESANTIILEARKKGFDEEKINALEKQLQQLSVSSKTPIINKKLTLKEKRQKTSETKEKKKRKVVNNNSPSPLQVKNLVEQYQKGRYEEAEKLAASITQEFPEHFFAWKVLGAVFNQTGRVLESLDAKHKAVELAPQDAEAHSNLANSLQELSRFDEAEVSYRKVIAIKPDDAQAHNNLGNALKSLGKLDEAEKSYRRAIALEPDFAEVHNNLGNALKELSRIEEAEKSYRKAITLNPNLAESHNNLGSILKNLDRLEESQESYQKAIALRDAFPEAHSNLGNTLQKLGKFKEAKKSYEKAIALKPDFAEAYSNLGIVLQELGKLKEAKKSFEKAITLMPCLAEPHNNLAITLKDLGRLDEAEASYRQAIILKPEYGEAHYNLGVQLFESKKYALAMEQFALTDHSESKKYAIRASYLQDDEATFFEKLDFLINQGVVNATIGSLVFCSEVKYGVKKSNPFCSHPLKYFIKTDLNAHYDFENIFIKPAVDILTDDSMSRKSQSLLTNGTQTAGNIFIIEEIIGTEIESIIRAEIEKYRVYFKDSEEGFIKNWPTSYSIYGWLVSMQKGGKLDSHMHHSGWLSGSIYINVPPKSKPDSGNLVLCTSDKEDLLAAEKGQESIIDVVTGSLCFFPSSLHHYTIPFDEEENRIVLAFDIIPT